MFDTLAFEEHMERVELRQRARLAWKEIGKEIEEQENEELKQLADILVTIIMDDLRAKHAKRSA